MTKPRFPPVIRAIAAQAVVFAFLVALRQVVPFQTPVLVWVILQGTGASIIGRWWHLGHYWMLFQITLPIALAMQMGHPVPIWVYPLLLAILLLIYGGGIISRVPLYNSGLPAWEILADMIPEGENVRFVDLGAGLGGPLAHIARNRPCAALLGVEASPLVWLIGWMRTAKHRVRNNGKGSLSFRFGSIWKTGLSDAQFVYAFLSPAPMPKLWEKVKREMPPGSTFISHTFEVPGQTPDQRIPLPGRKGACLLVYRL